MAPYIYDLPVSKVPSTRRVGTNRSVASWWPAKGGRPHTNQRPQLCLKRTLLMVPIFFVAVMIMFVADPGAASTVSGVLDASDQPFDPFQSAPTNIHVFIFVSIECPISNRYAPEVRRLREKFGQQGISFWLVYPNRDETAKDVRQHWKDYGYTFPPLRDAKHELVRRSRVRVTPEAAVFSRDGRLVYHGRIDNWYADFGKYRPEPTERDLEQVLIAITSGKKPSASPRPAIGCSIPD